MSPRLQELASYYSNRLSYEEVAGLLERITGERLVSDQGIWQLVTATAERVSQRLQQEVESSLETAGSNELEIETQLDLYDPEVAEVLLFQDGIQVKQQKQSRLSRYQRDNASISKLPGIITDIALLQKRDGTFEYVTAPIDANGQGSFDLGQVLKAKTVKEYSSVATPLNLVAITDGARSIARQLRSAFGEELVMILDWYHLCKKLRSMMSMIAQDKEDKAAHLKVLIPKLWLGQVDDAIAYLETQVTPRREDKWRELTRYLGKHKAEIVNYNRRSRAGKTIGTGRMERGVDLTIGRRQKKKGISWRPKGSRALALLKVVELNNQWNQLWFPKQVA